MQSPLLLQSTIKWTKRILQAAVIITNSNSCCVIPLQTLQRRTETLWSELEPLYARLSQSLHLMAEEEKSEVEKDWERLARQWRKQQECLKSRSVDDT